MSRVSFVDLKIYEYLFDSSYTSMRLHVREGVDKKEKSNSL